MPRPELRFEAIGVPWAIETAEPLPATTVAAIHERIARFDRDYSRFRADSLVSRITREPGRWRLPDDAGPLLDLYRLLYDATDGAMNPLVGQRLEELGYDRDYTLRARAGAATRIPSWEEAISWDGSHLTTLTPVVLDIGAAGKGYLIDLVADLLRECGVDDYLIDASGDLLHRGPDTVRVGLEHPWDPTMAIGVYELSNGALCASAPGRRAWSDGLHHILDATSGEPTRTVAATWVRADSALEADALATALFFASEARLSEVVPEFEYARMMPDGRVGRSERFNGELFL